MITPVFSIEQDDDFIIVTIRAPYAKISETEIEYVEKSFFFSSPPYYLRLVESFKPIYVLNLYSFYLGDKRFISCIQFQIASARRCSRR